MSSLAAKETAKVYTVSELNRLVKERLESDPRVAHCHVTGEISNFKHHSSGHMYFTLKDEHSRIRAVMFGGRNRQLRFRPEDGMRVICIGNLGVFDRDGQYQLYVDDMQPDGIGALYVKFEQLRKQLQAEGLFADTRKRPLPAYPRRIGVVTSLTGAVIRDIYTTLARRYPLARLILAPASVQGPGAADTLVQGLQRLWALAEPVDVIIIGRGGGSLEELWPFNEEQVARAVAASPVPIVSAVGHETDVTICDFVADVRAATPTAAAELVAPHRQDISYQLTQLGARANAAVAHRLDAQNKALRALQERPVLLQPARIVQVHRQTVDYLETRVQGALVRPLRLARRRFAEAERKLGQIDLHRRLMALRYGIDTLQKRSQQSLQNRIERGGARLDRQIGMLEALNPLGVLRRGYSVVYDEDEARILTSVQQLSPGTRIRVRVADGTVNAEVTADGRAYSDGKQAKLDI